MLTKAQAKQAEETNKATALDYLEKVGCRLVSNFKAETLRYAQQAMSGYPQYQYKAEDWDVYCAKQRYTTKAGLACLKGDYVLGRRWTGFNDGLEYIELISFRNGFGLRHVVARANKFTKEAR